MADADTQKRLKALNKKLGQISKLKEKDQLTPEEQEKVDSEGAILKEIRALESGQPLDQVKAAKQEVAQPQPTEMDHHKDAAAEAPSPAKSAEADNTGVAQQQQCETEPVAQGAVAADDGEQEQEAVEAPQLEPAEAEKRIKALKKKLAQIDKLKDKENLSAEEQEKVDRKAGFEAEIQEMEIGLLEPEAKKSAIELQRKLEQIRKLKQKSKSQLNSAEKDKISKEKALLKEYEGILGSKTNGKAGN